MKKGIAFKQGLQYLHFSGSHHPWARTRGFGKERDDEGDRGSPLLERQGIPKEGGPVGVMLSE